MSFNNKDVTKFAAKAPFKLINDKGKPIIEVTHDGKASKIEAEGHLLFKNSNINRINL